MATQVNEVKSAKALIKSMELLDFNVPLFTYFFTHAQITVQKRLFDVMIQCIWTWCRRYDEGAFNSDDEMGLYAEAKRLQDTLVQFGYRDNAISTNGRV